MIPKVIHYCWFGRNPLPKTAIKCINSWKKFFPDYEIRQWNEDNFDVNAIPYTAEAYAARKYAFVSDYARFWVLEQYGGVYFDTDVEVIKDMTPIISAGPFMGCELPDATVAPGLGLAAEPHMDVYRQVLDGFRQMRFLTEEGVMNRYTMIPMVTDLLRAHGLQATTEVQQVMGVTVYPYDYFNPLDIATGQLRKTANTYTIHWFMASWQKPQPAIVKKAKQYARRLLRLLHHQ